MLCLFNLIHAAGYQNYFISDLSSYGPVIPTSDKLPCLEWGPRTCSEFAYSCEKWAPPTCAVLSTTNKYCKTWGRRTCSEFAYRCEKWAPPTCAVLSTTNKYCKTWAPPTCATQLTADKYTQNCVNNWNVCFWGKGQPNNIAKCDSIYKDQNGNFLNTCFYNTSWS